VQLAGAVATIANDGVPVHPTLLKKIAATQVSESPVIAPRTSALIRSLMRLVVTSGTAKKADVDGYMIGGKTGTADKLVNGHYAAHERLSSFIGLFPINAPHYLVFALLDNPKGNTQTAGFATGGWVSAPIVNRTVAQIAPLLGMPPLSKEDVVATERQILKPLGNETVDGVAVAAQANIAATEPKSGQ
jgi:cell division protein FtsI (penicillin-binding protein 3)